eukprot:scaffold96725_cov23-Prasinocladus_malaysianus.AAC.1
MKAELCPFHLRLLDVAGAGSKATPINGNRHVEDGLAFEKKDVLNRHHEPSQVLDTMTRRTLVAAYLATRQRMCPTAKAGNRPASAKYAP